MLASDVALRANAPDRATARYDGHRMTATTREKLPTFCPLCVSRCGAIATIEDGALTALEPDPSHPTGQALCIKGKAGSVPHRAYVCEVSLVPKT